jgi:hypothetical protein
VTEVIPSQRAEAVCSKYILQYIFGATATAAVVPLIDAIGIGWSFTICECCLLLLYLTEPWLNGSVQLLFSN